MAKRRRRPQAPAGLTQATAALWSGLLSDLEAVTGGIAQVDLLQLEELLRSLDRLRMIRAELDEHGPTVTGSRGQVRPHPLLDLEERLRRSLADGFARLGLDPTASSRSSWTEITTAGRLRRVDPFGFEDEP